MYCQRSQFTQTLFKFIRSKSVRYNYFLGFLATKVAQASAAL